MASFLGKEKTLEFEDHKVEYIGNFSEENVEGIFIDLIILTRSQTTENVSGEFRSDYLTIPLPVMSLEIASIVAVEAKLSHRIRKTNREKVTY
jgi:hypothetical protein